MATWYSQISGSWSNADTLWNAAADGSGAWGIPADGDSAVVQEGHSIEFDVDQSAWVGLYNLTIQGSESTPGMVYFKHSVAGSYYMRFRTVGTTYGLVGSAGTNKGRLLANSDGVWGNTGVMPFDRKCTLRFDGNARLVCTYLDVALLCTEPTVTELTPYGTAYPITYNHTTGLFTAAGGLPANGSAVFLRSTGTLPEGLHDVNFYYTAAATGNDFTLRYIANGVDIDMGSAGTGDFTMYTACPSGSATVNVIEDVTAVAGWTTGADDGAVTLVNAFTASHDQQRVYLETINAGSVVLSAVVDSAQQPHAKLYLVSRNVRIHHAPLSTAIICVFAPHAGTVIECECREVLRTGTSFYSYFFSSTVAGFVFNAIVSGCFRGVTQGAAMTIGSKAKFIGNYYANYGNAAYVATVEGGEFLGNYFAAHTSSLVVTTMRFHGNVNAINVCDNLIMPAEVIMTGNNYAFVGGTADVAYCDVHGGLSSGGTSNVFHGNAYRGHCTGEKRSVFHGNIYGSGIANSSDLDVFGNISHGVVRCLDACTNVRLHGAELFHPNTVISSCYSVVGWGVRVTGSVPVQIGNVAMSPSGYNRGVTIYDPKDADLVILPGRMLSWQRGGTIDIEVSPPASAPAGVPAWCQVVAFNATYGGAESPVVGRYPIYLASGAISVDVHVKSSVLPSELSSVPLIRLIALIDGFETPLDTASMAESTDWQTLNLNPTLTVAGWYELQIVAADASVATTFHYYPMLDQLFVPGEAGGGGIYNPFRGAAISGGR